MNDRRNCPECRADVEADDSACPFCDAILNVPTSKKKSLLSASSTGWTQQGTLAACPDCGAAVSVRAQSCPQCGCPSKVKPRPTLRAVASVMIGAFFLSVLANRGAADRRGEKVLKTPQVMAGDRAVLACSGGDGVYVAFGIEAWSRMSRAQARHDTAEMERLMDADRVSLVAAGTPVEVVAPGTMMVQLRVLAGRFKGREGWVRKGFVRSASRGELHH